MPILNEAEQSRENENQKMEFDQANLSAGERIAVSFGLQLAIVFYNILHQCNIWIFSDVENDLTLSIGDTSVLNNIANPTPLTTAGCAFSDISSHVTGNLNKPDIPPTQKQLTMFHSRL